MAIGPDRVQIIKQESAALGGNAADDVEYPSPINATQDAIESAGHYFQDASNRDEAVYIAREAADMVFADQVQTTPVTLTQLLQGDFSEDWILTWLDSSVVVDNNGNVVRRNNP